MYAVQKPVFIFAHGDSDDLSRKLKANLRAGRRPLIEMKVIGFVTPAQAGVQVPTSWIPAFAGMT
jgi:hypothetical protein